MFDKHFVGLNLTGIEDNGIQRPISRVTLKIDDENALTAGDDTGMELLADCPHATQEMVNSILTKVKGYQYRMFSADDTALDPAAELGDGGTFGGVYSTISRIADDGSGYSGVTAPGEAELEDEYPAAGPMTQEFNRKIAGTRSYITKTAEQIRLEVANEVAGLKSEFTVSLDSITARVEGTEESIGELKITSDSITSRVEATEEGLEVTNTHVSAIEQYAKSIRLSVTNGETSSFFQLTAGDAVLSSGNIRFTGYVTFAGLSGGTTTIDGACIKTGTISADRIDVSDLKVNTLWGASDKVAIYSNSEEIYVGGRSFIETFKKLYLYGEQIEFRLWGDTQTGVIVDNYNKRIYPLSGIWNLGKESGSGSPNSFNECFFHSVSVKYLDNHPKIEIKNGDITCSSTTGSNIGSSSVPWGNGYFNTGHFENGDFNNLTVRNGEIKIGTSTASIGFFGHFSTKQQSVSEVSSSSTLANAITGINNVIKALKAYGLFK